MSRHALLAAAALALGCGGEVGVIRVSLATAPESDLLERIQRVRAILSEPRTVVEAERTGGGALAIDIEIPAENGAAQVSLEGFDEAGELIAVARSAPLPVSAINAAITLYVAPPVSLGEAPVALDPPRSEIGAAILPFGAIVMGGRDADGAPVDDVVIYNVYRHELQEGLALPEPRASATVLSGESDLVYLFGGLDEDGEAIADGWSFNTQVAPAGSYGDLSTEGDLARAGADGVFVADEMFLITGTPALRVEGARGEVSAWPDAPPMADGAAARLATDTTEILVAGSGVGDSGAVAYDDEYRQLDAPAEARRADHAVVALPSGRALIVGGALESGEPTRSAVDYDPDSREFTVRQDFLATARIDAAIAASSEVVLVAGGLAGDAVSGDAEVFDATTLEPVGTLALVVPRRGATALVLPNGQILLAGGTDQDGAPVGTLELFTPAEP